VRALAFAAGAALLAIVLWDVFETIVLPRRVSRSLRLTRLFFIVTWKGASTLAGRLRPRWRDWLLGIYGPLWLILLLMLWSGTAVVAYALLQWGAGSHLGISGGTPGLGNDLYLSGTTFFTLGLGDVVPKSSAARTFVVIEGATGFFLLALVIGYLPTLYQAFSRRETSIVLLDAQAGSPPCAAELLRRSASDGALDELATALRDWERWCAEVLESHLSYPVLALYRSQHDNESWLGALTVLLDLCSLLIAGVDGVAQRQARLTFGIARHCAVDLSQVFRAEPRPLVPERLDPSSTAAVWALLEGAGVPLHDRDIRDTRLHNLRAGYEPYVAAIGRRLLFTLPPWLPPANAMDNWKSSAWEHEPTVMVR
jgi:hypothetical protein